MWNWKYVDVVRGEYKEDVWSKIGEDVVCVQPRDLARKTWMYIYYLIHHLAIRKGSVCPKQTFEDDRCILVSIKDNNKRRSLWSIRV